MFSHPVDEKVVDSGSIDTSGEMVCPMHQRFLPHICAQNDVVRWVNLLSGLRSVRRDQAKTGLRLQICCLPDQMSQTTHQISS